MTDLKNFSFGKTKRDERYKDYPFGLDEIIYELAELIDREELTEENKDYYIKMYSDKLRDIKGVDRIEYFRKIFEIFHAEDKEKQPLPKPYMTNDA